MPCRRAASLDSFETRNAPPDEGCVGPGSEVFAGDEVMVAVNASVTEVSAGNPDRALFDLGRIQDLVNPACGRVKIDREAGQGTSAVDQDIREDIPAAGNSCPSPAGGSAERDEAILIVEDDALVAAVVPALSVFSRAPKLT